MQDEDVRMLHEMANALLVRQLDPYDPYRYPDFCRDLATRVSALRERVRLAEVELELERRRDHGFNAFTEGYETAMADYAAGRTANWPKRKRAARSASSTPSEGRHE